MFKFIVHMFNHFFIDSKIVVKQWDGYYITNIVDEGYKIKHYYILTEFKNGNRNFTVTGYYAKEHSFYSRLINWKNTGLLPLYAVRLYSNQPSSEAK